ncbi:putative cytoplasmic protein [Roseibium sp. TrichSKD4]|uniref:YbjN domain-containing protein n=1 Tax=Roseibium sp. TrichSKD4 TaxID=744980 RepID=UPI0001E56833|nr:YbjN domain-containing protein [Roseibium sp. TrichSKD4]EFO31764.1 putative cytoplasmic protein [Roseibium sp. TrichSKD4]
MSLIELEFERPDNPVDAIETVAALNDWTFERSGDDEITISIAGSWCDYHVSFSWMEEVEALHLAVAFDLKVLEPRKNEIVRLLALVNEQLWMGHFDLWHTEGVVMFRQSLLLAAGAEANSGQIEGMLTNALENCERYYQAFQFVIWAGKSADEAVEISLFETAGEA